MTTLSQVLDHLRTGESLRFDVTRKDDQHVDLVVQPRRANASRKDLEGDDTRARLVTALDAPARLTLSVGDGGGVDEAVGSALQQLLAERGRTRSALDDYCRAQSEARKHSKAAGADSGTGAASGSAQGGEQAGSGETGSDASEAPVAGEPTENAGSLI